MSFLLLIIAILLTLLIVLLAVPVMVTFRIDRVEETRGQVSFKWLFGLLRFRIGIPVETRSAPQRKRKPVKNGRERKAGNNVRGALTLLQQSSFRRRTFRFIKDLLCAAHARDLYLCLRVGLGDPADTGRLWAFLGPVAGIAASLRSAEVRLEPEFTYSALAVESHGEFRLIPLQFIALAAAFAVSPATLLAWRTLRRSNA